MRFSLESVLIAAWFSRLAHCMEIAGNSETSTTYQIERYYKGNLSIIPVVY